jgi:hypothetical protein|tara:strand:- start:432 stop:818 length:387 start_codon:yes stop_codon:yes gene_type:complete
MSPTALGKFIETVGVPVAMAAACGFVVWWLLKWLTGSLAVQIREIKQEIKDETDDVQKEVRQLHGIAIGLIDRIRVLERNTLLAHTTMLGQLGCKELPIWHETRKEKIAELKEQIKDIGRNGEVNDSN